MNVLLIYSIQQVNPTPLENEARIPVVASVRTSWRVMRGLPILFLFCLIAICNNLISGVIEILSAGLVLNVFSEREQAFALISAGAGLAGVLALSGLPWFLKFLSRKQLFLLALLGMLVCSIVLSVSKTLGVLILAYGGVIACTLLVGNYLRSRRGELIPKRHLAKTIALMTLFNTSVLPVIGMLIAISPAWFAHYHLLWLVAALSCLLGMAVLKIENKQQSWAKQEDELARVSQAFFQNMEQGKSAYYTVTKARKKFLSQQLSRPSESFEWKALSWLRRSAVESAGNQAYEQFLRTTQIAVEEKKYSVTTSLLSFRDLQQQMCFQQQLERCTAQQVELFSQSLQVNHCESSLQQWLENSELALDSLKHLLQTPPKPCCAITALTQQILIPLDVAKRLLREMVAEQLPQLTHIAESILYSDRLDAVPHSKKRQGAFTHSGGATVEAKLFMHYVGSLADFLVLAHELGHAVQFDFVRKHQHWFDVLDCDVISEVTSHWFERLAVDKLASKLADPAKRHAMQTFAEQRWHNAENHFLAASHFLLSLSQHTKLSLDRVEEHWLTATQPAYPMLSPALRRRMWLSSAQLFRRPYGVISVPVGIRLAGILHQDFDQSLLFNIWKQFVGEELTSKQKIELILKNKGKLSE